MPKPPSVIGELLEIEVLEAADTLIDQQILDSLQTVNNNLIGIAQILNARFDTLDAAVKALQESITGPIDPATTGTITVTKDE